MPAAHGGGGTFRASYISQRKTPSGLGPEGVFDPMLGWLSEQDLVGADAASVYYQVLKVSLRRA